MNKIPSNKLLILLEMNEVNFDVVKSYCSIYPGKFNWIEALFRSHHIKTTSEKIYEELEPWIQWVSMHTGKSFEEHKVFRLGDIVGANSIQIFEKLENIGIRVGCISPINTENRLMKPAFFLPDPWTRTVTDGSWWSNILSKAVSQTVNDNAESRISLRSSISIFLGLLRFAQYRHYGLYLKLILRSRGSPWRKALTLDLMLHDIHIKLFKKTEVEFSTLFLNSGAYIQHHYFFCAEPIKKIAKIRNPEWYVPSDADPFFEMLEVYNVIVGEYLSEIKVEFILATGLSQCPYDRVKYYYRLKNHISFLSQTGIKFESVIPRMTRDFLVNFSSIEDAKSAEKILRGIRIESDGESIFDEIDNRGVSLFVTLTYSKEVTDKTRILINSKLVPLSSNVVFVALKNGMHQAEGFAFFTEGVAQLAPKDLSHIKELHYTVMNYFSDPIVNMQNSSSSGG